MAASKIEKKSRSRRKALTEGTVSPSSDSSSTTASATPPSKTKPSEAETASSSSPPRHNSNSDSDADADSSGSPSTPVFATKPPRPATAATADQAFQDFYLRQATKEFANDLEALRGAGDFRGGGSVGVLVEGLRQGVACFGAEERGRVGGAAAVAGAKAAG